jgi:hypothetical protein
VTVYLSSIFPFPLFGGPRFRLRLRPMLRRDDFREGQPWSTGYIINMFESEFSAHTRSQMTLSADRPFLPTHFGLQNTLHLRISLDHTPAAPTQGKS